MLATDDGVGGDGPHPAVCLWCDANGLRPWVVVPQRDAQGAEGGSVVSAAAWMLTLAGLLFVLAVLSKGDM